MEKKKLKKKITELAKYKNSETYTKEALEENLDLLTKAYKRNLDTGEFSMAELDRARMNLIGKVHEAEKPAIDAYHKKHAEKTDKPRYESEFSDKISKLNTIAFLQSKSLRDNGIIPRLANDARANGQLIHTKTGTQEDKDLNDIKSATGDIDSALSELIEKSRNWKTKGT